MKKLPAASQVLLKVYKGALSPVLHSIGGLPGSCRFQPTCSEYAALAISKHGLLRGGAMAVWRLLRCHPLAKGGYDPAVKLGAFHAGRATRLCSH